MKALEPHIQAVHSRYWDGEKQAAARKQVLLVEGDDDRDVVEELLRQRRDTWETKVRVVVAGGRKRVLECREFPHAHMLVDRDTWTDTECPQGVYVTAGWCLENLFLDPEFLHSFDPQIATKIADAREPWVRAGALWWTLQRAREAHQDWQTALGWTYGAPREDLDLSSAATVRDSLASKIPQHLQDAVRLDLGVLAEAYDRRLQQVLALPEPQQWQLGVHGKEAFRRLLHPLLQAAHGQRNWRVELAGKLRRPPPFDGLLALLIP